MASTAPRKPGGRGHAKPVTGIAQTEMKREVPKWIDIITLQMQAQEATTLICRHAFISSATRAT